MTQEEALTIIKQACSSVVGNLEVHNKIQEAIRVVEDKLNMVKLTVQGD